MKLNYFTFLVLSFLLISCDGSNDNPLPIVLPVSELNVTTIAGGTNGNVDGVGIQAQFNYPKGMTLDNNGNLYISDSANHRIRKITPDGVVTTFAGDGFGYADGVGTNALFNHPVGICCDANGNLFVVDSHNEIIRKITPEGLVSTIAGTVGDWGFVDGVGTNAKFNAPHGITIDTNGNLYVADTYNIRIRKITPDGVVSTLAGTTIGFEDGNGNTAKFDKPFGINIDANGNLYVADAGNHKIRKVTPQGVVSTIAGSVMGSWDGDTENARFYFSRGVSSIHPNGNIYVGDTGNDRIRKITPNGEVINIVGSTIGSSDGTAAESKFDGPQDIRIDVNGDLYVLDTNNHSIRKITFN